MKGDSPTSYPPGVRSPVVEDTLSDIDEAITEISNSRRSRSSRVIKDHNSRHSNVAAFHPPMSPAVQQLDDSSSEYSKLDNSGSEIEEDDEEPFHAPNQGGAKATEEFYTETQVKNWTPIEVSKYLQSRQIPLDTCRKFEEQEVSGAILLQLEMPHLKELELGSFGKRFEVWKEIEYLIKKLRGPLVGPPVVKTKPRSGSDARLSAVGISQGIAQDISPRHRSSTVGEASVLPKIPSQHNRSNSGRHHINTQEANMLSPKLSSYAPLHTPMTATTIASSIGGPTTPTTPTTPPGVFKAPHSPTMSSRRSDGTGYSYSGPSKRLSSHELSPTALNLALSTSAAILTAGSEFKGHQRDLSFDRNWAIPALGGHRPSTGSDERIEYGQGRKTSTSTGTRDTGDSGFSGSLPQTPKVTERSYFSSGESTPREHKVLHKKGGDNHARKASYTEEQRLRGATAHAKQSRFGVGDTFRKAAPLVTAAHAYHIRGSTKDKQGKRKSSSFSGPLEGFPYDSPGPSPPAKVPGRRTTDDPVVPNPAMTPNIPTRSISESFRKGGSYLGSADGSTPSLTATTESDPLCGPPERPPKADRTQSTSGRRIRGVSSGSGLRQKSKKQNTSAWEKGLREITPQAAAEQADFSGWMKKRGSTGIGVWKPRFFVLQGRRLSYFYADTDTKERGLIDITSHRVLSATDDRFVSLHAQFAAATSPNATPNPLPVASPTPQSAVSLDGEKSPTSPPPTASASERKEKGGDKEKGKDKEEKERGWFTFKLVPPAPGASKGVTFTPPRLHYFATDTREEGKKWMGAIMKATIDRDESKPVISSYNAKTISLTKARQLRARPPELASAGEIRGEDFHRPGSSTSGLAISGVEFGDGEEADDEDGQDESTEIPGNGEAESSHTGDGGEGGAEATNQGRVVVEVVEVDDDEKDTQELMALVGNLGIIA